MSQQSHSHSGHKNTFADYAEFSLANQSPKHHEVIPIANAELKQNWEVRLPWTTGSMQICCQSNGSVDQLIILAEAPTRAAARFEMANIRWIRYWTMVIVKQFFICATGLFQSQTDID